MTTSRHRDRITVGLPADRFAVLALIADSQGTRIGHVLMDAAAALAEAARLGLTASQALRVARMAPPAPPRGAHIPKDAATVVAYPLPRDVVRALAHVATRMGVSLSAVLRDCAEIAVGTSCRRSTPAMLRAELRELEQMGVLTHLVRRAHRAASGERMTRVRRTEDGGRTARRASRSTVRTPLRDAAAA
ncbi:hypothetical protein [Microbacterium sp. NPDC096154]|uniref:hypothetical protein n=1 Tax=Microbacterium sp. NPDC096154 TaxID=3155549 RepID=UPI003318BF96